MIFIERRETNPYFNIAAEEYILKNFSEDVLMLWASDASVIVGKHQNALAEVNLDFTRENNIPLIRRISGGGTVFHGPGNINYTLITTNQNREKLIDFQKFTKPVLDFLETLGIEASFEGKNNLQICGKKFSGNSAHVFKNRVLHHGTLLFSTDLDLLDKSILPPEVEINDKAVQSVRATVGNIKDHLPLGYSFARFTAEMRKFLIDYFSIKETFQLKANDHAQIQKMADEKYSQWDWNFGYSPAFTFRNAIGDLSMEMKVKNGLILEVSLEGDVKNKAELALQLIGCKHQPGAIKKLLDKVHDSTQSKTLLSLFGF